MGAVYIVRVISLSGRRCSLCCGLFSGLVILPEGPCTGLLILSGKPVTRCFPCLVEPVINAVPVYHQHAKSLNTKRATGCDNIPPKLINRLPIV